MPVRLPDFVVRSKALQAAAALAVVVSQVVPAYAADPATRPAADSPNVVVILADDLGYADLSIQGDTQIQTPNIDSIAKNGVRFTQGYVTGPYCSPTRAGLISGRYQERTGHDFNPEGEYEDGPEVGLALTEATIADSFHAAGYHTGAVGKWHLGITPQLHPLSRGFDEFFGFLPAAHPYLPRAKGAKAPVAKIPGQEPGKLYRNRDIVDEPEYTTDAFGREASAFIRRSQGQPFFLYFASNAVHTPMQATEKYLARFPELQDGKRKTHLAMLSALDDAVGKVLAALRETGAEDNTLIFFLSDNGGPIEANASDNGQLSGGKHTVWEGGIRVPFFFQWKKRLPQGADITTPVAQIDIFPTVLAAAGLPTPKGKNFDGVNFLSVAEQKSTDDVHKQLFWRFGAQWAVRDENWKLALTPNATKPALYDLSSDISETNDRSADYPEVVKKLTDEWKNWDKGNVAPRWVPQGQKKQAVPNLGTAAAAPGADKND